MDNQETIEKIKALNAGFIETKHAICYYYDDDKTKKVFTYQDYYNHDPFDGTTFSGDRMLEGFSFYDGKDPHRRKQTIGYSSLDEAEQVIAKFGPYFCGRELTPLIVGLDLNRLLSVNGANITHDWDQPSNFESSSTKDNKQVKDYTDVQKKVIEGLVAVPFQRSLIIG